MPELADRVRAAGSDQEARDALRGATNEQLRGVARELDIQGRSRARRKAEIQDVIVQGRSPQRRGDVDTTTTRGRLGVPDLAERERRRQDQEREERERRARERAELERAERERQERERRERVEAKVTVTPNLREEVVGEMMRQDALTPNAFERLSRYDQDFDTGRVGPNALAYVDLNFQRIHIRPEWTDKNSPIWQAAEDSRRTGWWTPSGAETPLQTTSAHEYGHHVVNVMFEHGEGRQEDVQRLMATIRDQLGVAIDADTEIPPHAGPRGRIALDRITEGIKGHPRVVHMVSAYGATNAHELLAEVWQEYSTMGARARPHIRAIGDVMRDIAEAAP